MRRHRGRSQSNWQRKLLPVAVASCFSGPAAWANPTGPVVVQGQASIAVQGNTLTVTNAPGTVINWQAFSIAGNEITRFIQQSQSSSVLNRVVGVNPSMILGALQSNGRVFLVNPNGITIGAGARIDVAGFLASTLNLSDADFLAGRMRFNDGGGAGSVVNHGSIATAAGGMVYLVGRDVHNSGIIRSPQGEILLAAGNSIELVDAQAPELRVQVTAPDNLAVNLGQLIAAGGRIGMYGTLLRHAGVASANTAVMGENGRIQFKAVKEAVLDAGSVISASGTGAGVSGGSVLIEGEKVVSAGTLAANAGDQAVAGSVTAIAQRELRLESGSRIEARGADYDSRGGRVYLYSHGDAFAEPGQVIDISGGVFSGHGGSGEFSAADFARFGGTVYGTAALGYNKGRFLIDPLNFSLAAGTINANTVIQAEDNITIDGDVTIGAGFTLTLLADHDDNGGSPVAGVWDTGGGGTGTVGVGSITRSGAFTISGGAGSNLAMYAAGGGIGIGGSGAIQADLNGGSLSVTINPSSVGSANVAVTQTSANALSVAGISASGRDVALTSGGTIGQSGAITAGLLTTTSAGGTVLNASNAVGSFNATNTTSGNIELTNTAAPLSITGISQAGGGDVIISNTGAITVGGATVTAGDLTLTASGTIGQTGAISADLLTTSSAGGTLLNSANTVGAFKATNTGTGNIELTNTTTTLDLQGITQNTGNVVIANTGAITQSAAGITTAANGGISVTASTDLTISQAVTAGGSGSVTLAGGNVTNTATVTGAGGVSINAGTGTFVNESSSTHQGIVSNGGGAAAVSIVADNVDLKAGGGAGNSQINAGTGTATLRAASANRNYDLGSETGGRLSLTATELDTVTAGGIAIGSTGSEGNINVSAAIAPANAARLELLAGGASGSITQTGTITETDLRLNSAGAITLNAANSVTNLAIGGGNSAVSFNNAGALNIATVNGQVGASTTGGNLTITATGGDLNVNQAVSAGSGQTNLATATSGNIVLAANVGGTTANLVSAGSITRTAGAVSGTHVVLDSATGVGTDAATRVTVTAGNLAARSRTSGGVFVSETDSVTLQSIDAGAGAVANTAAGGAVYDLTAAGTLTVGTGAVNLATATGNTVLRTTGGSSNGIVLNADAGNTTGNTTLVSTGSITGSGTAIGANVVIDSATGIGTGTSGRLSVTATSLAARSTAGGGVFLSETDGVTLQEIDPGSGAVANSAFGANAYDISVAGSLTIGSGGVNTATTGNTNLATTGATTRNIVLGTSNVGNATGNTVLLSSGGITAGTGTVIGSGVALDSSQGVGGSTSSRVNTSAATLAARASAAGGVFVSESNNVTLADVASVANAVTAGNSYDLLTVDGGITLGGNVTAAGNGNVTLAAGTLGAANDILAGAGRIATGSGLVTLSGRGIGVGAGSPLLSDLGTGTLKYTTTGAGALGDVAISNSTAGGFGTGQIDVASATDAGSAQTITLIQSAGNITTGTALNVGADNLSLQATAGSIVDGGAILTANDLRLDGHNAVGATGAAILVNTAGNFAARLTNASATGDIVVEEVAAGAGMSVGTANGISGVATTNNRNISLKANAGDLTISQAVNAGTGQIDLATATSGNIAIGANVSGGTVNVLSVGNITRTAGTVGGTDVVLDAATGIGGGTGSRVFTAADNLAARSTTSGGVFVSESNAVTLTTLSGVANGAAGSAAYDLSAGGTITVSAAVNAGPATGSTNLATTTGNIALAADVGNAGGATTLTSAGEITRTAGSVIGSGVLLDAATAIGSSGARIATTAGTLAARTGTGATGGIFITEADNVSLGTVGAVSGISAGNGGEADLRTTAGDITLAANVSATGSGNLTLIAGGGAGNDLIAGAGRVSTGSGLVTLQGDAVGTTVAPILTDLGSGTLAATSSAGNIAISNNTAGGLNSNQLTGLTTGGGVQTVSIVQTAGNLTVGGSLNLGSDTLVLGASAGDILGGAGTLTAAALTLDAGGLIGGASAVNTATSSTLTLNSGGSSAAGNITVSEANALPASRVSLGGAGAGSGRTVKLTSVAGPITIDAAIGNAADHLELVTTAGNIAGGAGTISAANLTLNAAAGIGAGTAVNTSTSGNLSLTTAGNGTAGDIALVESNALNTTRVTALTTSGTGTQSVSLTAPSITLGAAIGNASDNLTLIAGSGTISGGSIVTANDLRLDAHNGIGSTGTPVQINTAGNFAARLTNASASGDIVVEEVAAGAGLTVGAANGISGVATTNNRAITLSAVSGNIVLNQTVNSGSGQARLTTTGSGNVSVAAGISGGLVDITSAGTISDSAQISGSTLTTSSVGGTILDFGHAVSGFNASNITGGNIQLVNTASTLTVTGISQNGGGNVIVNNTGTLTIGGAINNAGSGGTIDLTGSTGINLNQNLTATDGAVTLNNNTTLGAPVQIAAGTGTVTLTGAVGIGSHNLTVTSSGITALTGGITDTTGNIDIAAVTRTDVDGAIALSGAGSVQLDRAVVSGVNVSSTGGGITFDGAAGTDTGPVQVSSGGGNVLFNDTLTLGSGAGLTVLSGAGTTTFGGAVNGPAALTVTAAGNTVFSSTLGAGTALASLSTDGGGTTQLNGASVATSGAQSYSDAVTLGANTTLTANSITFGSTLNSAVAARTLQINDSGTTTFSGSVGNSLALASLTTNAGGGTAINGGSITTSGAQVYNDAVALGANTTLSGSGITFNSTLNSSVAARTLQVNDSGTTTFGGTVGNSLALASLTTNAGGSTAINTTTLNTTGAQTYNDTVTLGADALLASSGGSDIRFLNTLDGASGLTVNTTGSTVFAMAVGSTTPLAFLTTNAGGSTQVNGGTLVTTGTQTYNDAVSIGGATTFNATATSASLDFNSTLAAAAHALTLSADEINLGGGAGSVTGTGTVTLQPNSTAAAINVGSAAGATAGALDLAAADIAALADGFAAINIGKAAGAHAVSVGNASFQDPLLVRAPSAGSIAVNGALSGTQQVTLEAGGAVQGNGSVTAPLVKVVAGGIGSFATPLQINSSSIDVLNSAGNAVIRTSGSVTLANNFRNTASGGELRLITENGAINTAAVAVQSNNGRIALVANDTAGGSVGGITVGSGGISSGGGDIVLHAADNITVNGSVAAGTGSMRMIAGTGPGLDTAHALFTGSNPAVATEAAQDDFGMITLNAAVSAASMVLVSSTSSATTVTPVITQGAAGAISTTGALTAVSLRGGGAPGNGGGTIDLNDATGNNSTGLINLFACSLDGCPATLSTAPFVKVGAPVAPFTTALYSDGQLFYSDVGGTNVTGIGTSGDFTLYTPGSVTITGPSLSAKNLTIEALNNINVDLQAPFTNNDINGGQPGGSLNFIAGQNVNYTSVTAGATIGTAATPFNHDLRFEAAGNVTVANAIHVGTGNFVVRANRPVSLNNGTVNIAATGTGNVVMQGNHVVSSQGDITVSGVNLTLQGGDTGSLNQASAGQQLLANGKVNLDLTGNVTVNGGTATANSGSAAIIRGATVNVGSAATPVAALSMTGGTASVSGTADRVADALIEGTTALNVRVTGNVGLTGGTATITSTAGSTQKAGASAILKGNSLLFNVGGNVTLTGGTADAATGGNTATANAQVIASSAFSPVIQGDLNLVGGDATAQPISGEIANAVASARFESSGDLLLKVSGDIDLKGGQAVAINNAGGSFGEADAGAFVRSGARISIEGSQDFDVTGGSASVTGSAIRAIASAGVITGDLSAGETLLINTAGNMRLTGGTASGTAADAAALLFSGGEAKLTISGSGGLRLEGGSGPFFPPFDSGVFQPNSNLFHMIGDNALVQIPGSAYPITITGLVTIVPNPAKGAALFVSEAPPLSLDSLLAAFIRTTDCVSFSGGACTLSEAAAAGARRGAKDPAGGVCK